MTDLPADAAAPPARGWRPRRRNQDLGRTPSPGPVVALSLAITVICSFPLFLTGALAVQMRAELGFSVAALGLAASLYRISGAALGVPIGILADRLGPSLAMRVAAGLAFCVAAGIALFARSYLVLCLFLMFGGISNALGQSGANLSLSRGVRAGRQGIAFGLKQSALPAATLMAGVMVPVVALTIGWRWAFGIAALIALLAGAAIPSSADKRFAPTEGAENRATRKGPLLVLGLGLLLAMMAGSTLSTFTVDSAVAAGIAPGAAGLLLAFGAAVSILVRVIAGFQADRRAGGHFRIVAALIGLGAIGYVLMGIGRPWVFTLGTLIAFGLGWGFNGLFWYAIVRLNQKTPGRVTGMILPGGMLGGFIGPITFGWMVELAGYRTAWSVAAVWALLGCGVMLLGRRLVSKDVHGSAAAAAGASVTAPTPAPPGGTTAPSKGEGRT